jgi:hypothetical protein
VKLSAPPPPPPEPPEPGPAPDAGGPTPGAEAAGAPAETTAPRPKPAAWPGWFDGADAVLAVLAVTVAFLAASFAARNHDLWLHLGAGRMLTTGEYTLGSDPLSYTAADRPWVNHAWLWDLGAYLLYAGDGFVLVLVKALAVAAAFGLLLGIRRPPHSLWPWAVTAAVAVVAAAPRLTLTPLTGSVVLFCATLFVLFRVPARPGSWRVPALVGVLFWVWSNTDAWFVLGPLAVGLLLVGELVRGKERAPEEAADPLPLPDAGTLARALLVGIVACMLNPHHVRVWQLPFELVGSAAIDPDPKLNFLRYSPLTERYWDSPFLGANANGVAYALLLAAGLYAAFLSGAVGRLLGPPWDVDPLPLPHAALWFGLAALSLSSIYAVPFLAVATVPLVASRVNLFSARVRLGGPADRGTRLVLTASAGGRVLTALGLAALCAVAWPGWLHPTASNWVGAGPADPSAARRVAWAVEPDPELAKAAGWLGEQRAAGRLPADARGLIAGVELANYCAWYAPGEKVFVNGRYNHHRPELPEFVAARRGLGLIRTDEPPDPAEADRVFRDRGVSYVGVSAIPGDTGEARQAAERAAAVMWSGPNRWSPWYLDGRAAVSGWRASAAETPPGFDRLRVDPVRLAFGPGVEPVPPAPLDPPPPPRTGLDDFTTPARPAPPAADEALGWLRYKATLVGRELVRQQVGLLFHLNVPGVAVPPLVPALSKMAGELDFRRGTAYPRPPADGSFLATSVLAERAARRAIADNPAHPDGYTALARALNEPELPLSASEREVGRITALRQALSRFPPPAEFRRGAHGSSPTLTAFELARLYLGRQVSPTDYLGVSLDLFGVRDLIGEVVMAQNRRVFRAPYQVMLGREMPADVQIVAGPVLYPPDLAFEALDAAARYAAAEFGPAPPGEVQNLIQGIEEQRKQLDALIRRATDQYRTVTDPQRAPKVRDRYRAAAQFGLVGQRLALLKEVPGGDLSREFGPEAPVVALEMVALELAVGRLEEAAADLALLRSALGELAAQPTPPPGIDRARELARYLEYQVLRLSGDYAGAGRLLEEIDARGVEQAPPPDPPEAVLGPKNNPLVWPMVGVAAGISRAADIGFWGLNREVRFQIARQQILGQMDAAAQYYFRRGYLALMAGDPAAAKGFFARTRRPAPPPGWGLNALAHLQAEEYTRYIEAAEKAAAGW